MIMYGSGAHAGHSVMALRFPDEDGDGKEELYMIESKGAANWPVQGIQRNKFATWLQWAKNVDIMASHMPLSPEARAKFNETAAREYFYRTNGWPYGY